MWAALTSAVSFVAAWLKTSEALQTYVGKPLKWLGWVGAAIAVVVIGVTAAPIIRHWKQPAPVYVTAAQFAEHQKTFAAYQAQSGVFMRAMVIKAGELSKEVEQCRPRPAPKARIKAAPQAFLLKAK